MNSFEVASRFRKVMGIVRVIDANVRRQNKCPIDQAGAIMLAAHTWPDALWLSIAKRADEKHGMPSAQTRADVIAVYRERAHAPLRSYAS